jgi:hypothetical protein
MAAMIFKVPRVVPGLFVCFNNFYSLINNTFTALTTTLT